MKILFAGCKSGLARLQDALSEKVCEINELRDGSQLIREGQSYDWLILDGRTLTGEKDLAQLIKGYGNNRAFGCGIEVSESGVMQMSCCLQKIARGDVSDNGQPRSEPKKNDGGGFVFEYHAPCNVRQ